MSKYGVLMIVFFVMGTMSMAGAWATVGQIRRMRGEDDKKQSE